MPIDIDFVNRLGIDILQVSGIDMGYSVQNAKLNAIIYEGIEYIF